MRLVFCQHLREMQPQPTGGAGDKRYFAGNIVKQNDFLPKTIERALAIFIRRRECLQVKFRSTIPEQITERGGS